MTSDPNIITSANGRTYDLTALETPRAGRRNYHSGEGIMAKDTSQRGLRNSMYWVTV